MKKAKPLNELSLIELQQKKKVVLGAAMGLGVVMLIAVVVLVYVAITAKQPAFIAIGICSLINFLPIYNNLQKLNTEIKNRAK